MTKTERDIAQALSTAAAHWDARLKTPVPQSRHWWQLDAIKRHVNRIACGTPAPGMTAADAALLSRMGNGVRIGSAVSIGCGTASKELALLAADVVQHFSLYELSPARAAKARTEIVRRGLADRAIVHERVIDFTQPPPGSFDLVYWNNSLHHMFDVGEVLRWCRDALVPGGIFYMNDFVGPNRMQWPDDMLAMANAVRAALPDRFFRARDGQDLPREVQRPSVRRMIDTDPTECADSAAILPALRKEFPGAEVRFTGGVIYHLALKGLLHNFVEAPDSQMLDALLGADEALSLAGHTHYAVAYARSNRS